ncbi:hypothetical protein BDA99DRAFT_520612 [Phascolomyces articulosus]|uniref:Uncharacterized protein n=1 Tax=Phascolomyces articulosus TaxID=60185 RepID=A0AAD5K2M3_9FUNG|nr:hypothetical protein BDA99DRAFT_520612 [Phascolomyces articulosus]
MIIFWNCPSFVIDNLFHYYYTISAASCLLREYIIHACQSIKHLHILFIIIIIFFPPFPFVFPPTTHLEIMKLYIFPPICLRNH